MAIFRRNEAVLHYEDTGDGFPVLALAPGGLKSAIHRWRGHPERPDAPRLFFDPAERLAGRFRVVALDQRNAGASVAPVTGRDGWADFAADHLALLDHLGIDRFHVLGACIGASFALRLCRDVPGRVTAAVLQNPIGRSTGNQHAINAMYLDWEAGQTLRHDLAPGALRAFRDNMFAGDFVFSVSRPDVSRCGAPLLLLPGSDDIHAAEVSRDIASLAPRVEVLDPWKGPDHLEATAARVEAFLAEHAAPA